VFAEINQLQKYQNAGDQLKNLSNQPDIQTLKLIQTKIDYLDKAFFYYSKILMSWIKIHNTNPNYTEAFKERDQIKKLMDFQQKLLLKLLGQKQSQSIPTTQELKTVLNIDHRLATHQQVSHTEKKKLLNIWGFFSFVGNFSSLLQCGTLAPFTMPISIMNRSISVGNSAGLGAGNLTASLSEFSASIAQISVPEKQQLLKLLKKEEYVELDLTKNIPPAKKIYTVPKSYLEGAGCIVNENGEVLGPCFETQTDESGQETKSRIPLDDPRDTLTFPMTLHEFNQYVETLQKNIEQASLNQLDEIFQSTDFSDQDKRKAQVAIKKLRQKLIKKSLNLQDFISGNVTNSEFYSNNSWLKELIIKISFSQNPVQTLIQEVEAKLNEKDHNATQFLENLDLAQ